jgi:NAD(P)-dependent dehydrogenase (short-subunit alcohol dehydrogenase family)
MVAAVGAHPPRTRGPADRSRDPHTNAWTAMTKNYSNFIDWDKVPDDDKRDIPADEAINEEPMSFEYAKRDGTHAAQAPEAAAIFKADILRGKRILITGGGTGLGRAMTERFLQLGATCYICGRRQSVVEQTALDLMRAHGGLVKAYGLDIRDAAAVEAMVDAIFAEGPLTGLVNNAAGNFISRTEDLSPRGFDAIANIVMHGTFYVTHAVGKRWVDMARAGTWGPSDPYRSVISIIVTWVKNGGPYVVPSAMSKSAIDAMTKSLATEWAPYGVRLNAVGPGEIPTEGMSKRLNPGEEPGARSARTNPMARAGQMAELQNLATFLMSDGCQWLNGESIMMDGGNALATGGNFYALREWSDDQWKEARDRIEVQNKKDRAQRS